jgi:hypothetical protein
MFTEGKKNNKIKLKKVVSFIKTNGYFAMTLFSFFFLVEKQKQPSSYNQPQKVFRLLK